MSHAHFAAHGPYLRRHRLGPLRVQQLAAILEPQHVLQLLRLHVLAAERLHDAAPHDPAALALRRLRRRRERARVRVVLLDVGEAVLDAVDLLDDALRRLEQRLHAVRDALT
jgi:hypothetical protein